MNKTERLTLKVLPDQKTALETMAQTEGEPVAVILRRLIRTEAQRCGLLDGSQQAELSEAAHAEPSR